MTNIDRAFISMMVAVLVSIVVDGRVERSATIIFFTIVFITWAILARYQND